MGFWGKIFGAETPQKEAKPIVKHARVIVTAFSDSLKKNGGKIIFELLQKNQLLDVAYYANCLPAETQIINSKNLLDIENSAISSHYSLSGKR